METKIVGIKQLYKDLKKISQLALEGDSFIIVRNSKPVFRIEPISQKGLKRKKYTMDDLWKIRFKDRDKNLSKKIDKILYHNV